MKFPVFSHLTGKRVGETGSLETASTANLYLRANIVLTAITGTPNCAIISKAWYKAGILDEPQRRFGDGYNWRKYLLSQMVVPVGPFACE